MSGCHDCPYTMKFPTKSHSFELTGMLVFYGRGDPSPTRGDLIMPCRGGYYPPEEQALAPIITHSVKINVSRGIQKGRSLFCGREIFKREASSLSLKCAFGYFRRKTKVTPPLLHIIFAKRKTPPNLAHCINCGKFLAGIKKH